MWNVLSMSNLIMILKLFFLFRRSLRKDNKMITFIVSMNCKSFGDMNTMHQICYISTGIFTYVSAHCNRVMNLCISKLSNISSDIGLSPGRCQAIILTSAGILLISNLRKKSQWNCKWNSYIFIPENVSESVVYEMASICLCLNVLTVWTYGKGM